MSDDDDGIHILHVDDDLQFAEMTATFLTREHDRMTVETVASAREGLDRLADRPVDAIISDYEMSGRNGIEFLEAVRENYPNLPFLLFTGKGSEEVASEAISAGVTDYLQKAASTDQYTVLANRVNNAVTQYRTERELEETKQRYRRLIEESTDVITVVNEDGTFQYLSPAAEPLLGYSVAELVGESGFEYIHPDDHEFTVEQFTEQVKHPDRRITAEFRFERSDGTWIWLEARGRDLRDDPHIDGIVVYVRDVSERREREAELQRIRDRMEFALETMDAIVWDWNVDEDKATFYPSEIELYGSSVEGWEDFISLVHPEDRQTVRDGIDHALESGEPKREEIRIVQDDELRWIAAPGKPITEEDGSTRMVGIAQDITDHKETEQALERRNERLSEFASIVTHELRSPLSVAIGEAELVSEECDSDHLDAVIQAHERMGTLIEDMLTLAQSGESTGEVECVKLSNVIQHSWQNIETESAQLIIETNATIQADESRLQQLLENLFRNAIEHGGDEVTVTVGDLEDGFYVKDDGRGIPDDERERVFETGMSTSTSGTGFGLSIVNRIAEGHGWNVSVSTASEEGARFEITGVEIRQ